MKEMIENLTAKITKSYESGVTLEEAERLAGEFLVAQLTIADAVRTADLNARMRKQGLKAIRSAIRLEEVRKHDKKPSEGQLEDIVNTNELVMAEDTSYNQAEVEAEQLQNYLAIFKDAHLHFRAISRGRFE